MGRYLCGLSRQQQDECREAVGAALDECGVDVHEFDHQNGAYCHAISLLELQRRALVESGALARRPVIRDPGPVPHVALGIDATEECNRHLLVAYLWFVDPSSTLKLSMHGACVLALSWISDSCVADRAALEEFCHSLM